jgi:hypothetical protein
MKNDLDKIAREEAENYSRKSYGYCKCSPLDVIVRFENSNLSIFKWKHRYTRLNDHQKLLNIFRCSKCKEVIHDNFVEEQVALPTK